MQRLYKNLLMTAAIIIITQTPFSLSAGTTSDDMREHHFFIGFNDGQPVTHCTQVISRVSGKIIEKLRDFTFPVYLVKVDNALSPAAFEEKILSELEREQGVRFVSLERSEMKNPPIMEIKSTSIQRRGTIAISAPKKTNYDFVQNSTGNNAYYNALERHLPGLKARIRTCSRASGSAALHAVFEVDIDKEGDVKQVRMQKNNIWNPELRKQLKDKIYSWRDFPRRAGDNLVTVRFKLTSY